jgi:hypothetical protein
MQSGSSSAPEHAAKTGRMASEGDWEAQQQPSKVLPLLSTGLAIRDVPLTMHACLYVRLHACGKIALAGRVSCIGWAHQRLA